MLAHTSLARVAPEFQIDMSEATQLATAFVNWRRHYTSTIDPKTMDMITFFGILVAIEGPRVLRATGRRSQEQKRAAAVKQAEREAGGRVVGIDGQPR